MVLYKYLHPSLATKLLQNRRIRFTQPECFNDPFDSRPLFDTVVELELIEQICQIDEDDDADASKKFQAEMVNLWSGHEAKDWYAKNSLNRIAILCLTSKPDNLLMWAHYTDSHRGFVVGFETEHPSIALRADGEARNLREVQYVLKRPRGETLYHMPAEEVFYRKSRDWSYECEWRLFDAVAHAVHTFESNGETICLYDFHPEAVREVILGARMTGEPLNALTEALKHPDYKHVRVRRAEPHQEEYRVDVRDVPHP